jgi:lipopolysaccharide transport system ATP-binding protein
MSDLAVRVENVSKLYQLGQIGTGTISRDIERWWAKTRGKEDPFAKIGQTNDRTHKIVSDSVWALKDINFDVKKGEVLGVIGRNGAGKSTLLKILSKVTAPTTGKIYLNGRIASLLEVGTGFHPEMTGRENIFMNGALLGMRKEEIKSKFDEIVDFAGVEAYIDTPVKRYSSGMYVRLAFAVAAYLEPEILIVDEVLAVGDAEFQKKCLGRIKDVSVNDGRTVLFVSHNMGAIKNICNTGIVLENGTVRFEGDVNEAIENYFIKSYLHHTNERDHAEFGSKNAYISRWEVIGGIDSSSVYSRSNVKLRFWFTSKGPLKNIDIGLVLRDFKGDIVISSKSSDSLKDYFEVSNGEYIFDFDFRLPVKKGDYEVDIALVNYGRLVDQWVSPLKLKVVSVFDSTLTDEWLGIVSEEIKFSLH